MINFAVIIVAKKKLAWQNGMKTNVTKPLN